MRTKMATSGTLTFAGDSVAQLLEPGRTTWDWKRTLFRTGWGVVERQGASTRAVAAGIVRVREKAPIAERLNAIHEGVAQIIAKHQPHVVAVEDIFFAKYPQAALMLGHARGVALLAAAITDRRRSSTGAPRA